MPCNPLLMEAADISCQLLREQTIEKGNQERPTISKANNEEEKQDENDVDDEREQGNEEREHMFDKPLTPSDVGKLNRLVIPKQQAEKYFPLDYASNEKGLLLSFEDNLGKAWRFRYSYWNSSQSYVLTKGWSRFVKEKKLDAGDVISFERRVGGKRLYISWRRRQNSGSPPKLASWNRFLCSSFDANTGDPVFYLRTPNAVPCTGKLVGSPSPRPKRVRLFGVNLDRSPEPREPDDSYRRVQSGIKSRPTDGSSSSTLSIDFDN